MKQERDKEQGKEEGNTSFAQVVENFGEEMRKCEKTQKKCKKALALFLFLVYTKVSER